MARLIGALLLLLAGPGTHSEEIQKTCIAGEDCMLPCRFREATSELIHWYRNNAVVHSFYYGKDQLDKQDKYFQNRTSLFQDQIPRGNASLLLHATRIQDRGKYLCYSSTSLSSKELSVILEVKAPIKSVDLSVTGDEVRCLSRDIYPAPSFSWSTDPSQPSDLLQPSNNSIQESDHLFSVDSKVRILGDCSNHTYICTITSADQTQTWEASLKCQDMIGTAGQALTIPCLAPRNLTDFTLTWSFIGEQASFTILTFRSLTAEVNIHGPDQAQVNISEAKLGNGTLQLPMGQSQVKARKYNCTFSSFQSTHTILTYISVTDATTAERCLRLFAIPLLLWIVVALGCIVYIKRKEKANKLSLSEAVEMNQKDDKLFTESVLQTRTKTQKPRLS
ncbi:hypothetical protein GN956_G4890 [Arapaima gigas]